MISFTVKDKNALFKCDDIYNASPAIIIKDISNRNNRALVHRLPHNIQYIISIPS